MTTSSDLPRWARDSASALDRLEVHQAVLELPNGRRVNLVAASKDAILTTGHQIDGYLGQLRPLPTGTEPSDDDIWDALDHAVGHIESLVRGHDAFDIMTMLRQYMVPPDLAVWSESGSSLLDAWSAAEVVALVLLGLGLPTREPGLATRTATVIPELVSHAATVVQLASIMALVHFSRVGAVEPTAEGLSSMALRLSSHETSVRGRQYAVISEQINTALLRNDVSRRTFHAELGFTYDDVLATRGALVDTVGGAFEQASTTLLRAVERGVAPDAETAAAAKALFQNPALLQMVTAEQLAAGSPELTPKIAGLVLDRFSIRADGRTPRELVRAFVNGKNPLAGVAILHDPLRGYLPLPGALALDEIRRTCEATLKLTTSWTRYSRARDKSVEVLVADTLSEMVGGRGSLHRGLRYRDPQAGHDLSRGSTDYPSAPLAEADALLVLDGVAVCVEVKAGGLRPRARQGGLAQLEGDLEKTVKEAASQAERLRSLIVSHHGLWREDGQWLDLSHIQEVHAMVACLDDLGPLALSTSEMVRSEILPQAQLPWVVSVHDLLVVKDVLARPEQFLTYLRRRTNRDAALWITGSDELDILMWFVAGGFYFVPDPDRIHREHPGSKPPTARMRREYAEQGRTIVGTFTDPLDSHYYWLEGTSSRSVDCPRRGDPPDVLLRLVDTMRENNAPGWWRAGADLDGYSAKAQEQMAENITQMLALTNDDGQFHTFTTGGTDDTGRWILIFASGPVTPENCGHLEQYLAAKKHQDHADRALGALMNPDGSPNVTLWLAHPPEDDPALDALARAMRLIPADRAPSAIPPKAKARSRSKSKRRGARRRRRR